MKIKNAIFTTALAMASLSLSAQVYGPITSANSATPSTSIGINTNAGNNRGTLHVGKKFSISAESWTSASLQYNTYLDGSTRRLIFSDNTWGAGVGNLKMNQSGFAFEGLTTYNLALASDATITSPLEQIMNIRYNGNIGIGGVSAAALNAIHTGASGVRYHLFVKGGIKTEEIKVELCTGSWCDYVFADDYNLKTLEEVEATIQEKGHLHNIDSAEKLEKEGLELKSITINQQEKIEELFLHMIEMNKRMKALETENASLKTQVQELSK